MAEKDRDDLADALKRLSHGDAQDDSEHAAPSESLPLDIPPPARKQVPPPPVAKPRVVKPTPKPAVPKSTRDRPAAPIHRAKAPEAPAPVARQPDVEAKPSTAPTTASDEISSSLANVIDDSELSVNFSAIATGPKLAARTGPSRSLQTRRTLIPILLTLGVGLPLTAIWWFTLDMDAPMKEIGTRFPFSLLGIGAVMLALAVVNMISVKKELHQ